MAGVIDAARVRSAVQAYRDGLMFFRDAGRQMVDAGMTPEAAGEMLVEVGVQSLHGLTVSWPSSSA